MKKKFQGKVLKVSGDIIKYFKWRHGALGEERIKSINVQLNPVTPDPREKEIRQY